ncbi:MAG: RNA polymerase sigma factor [Actinomycetota bacterium]
MRKAELSDGSDERTLVEALRAGDEAAFMTLVERYGASMLRVARTFVPTQAVAEDVVQEAWLGVLRGLDRFEGRSSLKTWIFRILTNVAKTRGERESRSVPFSSLAGDETADPAVEPSRFDPPHGSQGMWAAPPASWEEIPEDRLLAGETLTKVREAIAGLPPQQRTVITLRDVEGWTSDEVRNVLEISETNQRVLLHRARSKVRRALEEYVGRYERA